MINGIEIKELMTHVDKKGFFREILKKSDKIFSEGFGQLNHSIIYTGVEKKGHLHNIQIDWWYVVSGIIEVELQDMRYNSKSYLNRMIFLMGDNQESKVIKIPSGVAHGYKCIQGPANIIYITSEEYNKKDELRIYD